MAKHYHFIGIGGIGMSAIARILLHKKYKVSGSDLAENSLTEELRGLGAQIHLGHKKKNVGKPDVVVYSSAVSTENCEFQAAQEKKIPLIHRSEALSQLMVGMAPLLVTGTHGKTTTSSLLAHLLLTSGFDPSYAIGGKCIGGQSSRLGKGIHFVAEADESDGTFLHYSSFGAIVTNAEPDHMEFWKEEKTLYQAFKSFADDVGSKEHLFWCYDDLVLRGLGLKGYSYGFSKGADLFVDSFRQEGWKLLFDFTFKKKKYRDFEFPLIGAHNVLNAVATIGMALQLDLSEENIRKGLKTFPGVGRRMEKKGEIQGIALFDDYAHHPTEIFSTLRALKMAAGGRRIVVVFQPHRASRTKICLGDFPDAFKYADSIIVTDIYKPKDEPHIEVSAADVVALLQREGRGSALYVPKPKLIDHLLSETKRGDLILTMGAGDITYIGPAFLEKLGTKQG